jgi:A/G-specific adenine glycosylase
MSLFSLNQLRDWFLQQKRSFPWRDSPNPYAVWVSEVMLQQTRASVVISYFKKWMNRFPTISSLSSASVEEVCKAWEGLGYYSRARNLHKGARQVMERGGKLPSSLEGLRAISGIGAYTAGAIVSFAFHQKAAAIDANVQRVMSRYKGIEGNLKNSKYQKLLEQETLAFLPEEESWIAMEALIELGALVCKTIPQCDSCPLRNDCHAFLKGKTDQIPYKQMRQKTIFLEKQVVILLHQSHVLVEQKEEGKVLGGLFEFPSFPYLMDQNIEEEVLKLWGLSALFLEDLPLESQSFTRYKVDLYPALLEVQEKKEVPGFLWYPL